MSKTWADTVPTNNAQAHRFVRRREVMETATHILVMGLMKAAHDDPYLAGKETDEELVDRAARLARMMQARVDKLCEDVGQ